MRAQSEETLRVEDASEGDIAGILAVQTERIIVPEHAVCLSAVAQTGFLVYPIDDAELAHLLRHGTAGLIKVAKEGERVTGYLVCYDLSEWTTSHQDWFDRLEAPVEAKESLRSGRILYGRHIAIAKESSSGTGKMLLASVLQEAVKHGYGQMIVEVLKEPLTNERSAAFVRRAGFAEIGRTKDAHGRTWSVFQKTLAE